MTIAVSLFRKDDKFYTQLLCGESLFLRKLVLGIPAQASGKNGSVASLGDF
jgi:hypothetical protein